MSHFHPIGQSRGRRGGATPSGLIGTSGIHRIDKEGVGVSSVDTRTPNIQLRCGGIKCGSCRSPLGRIASGAICQTNRFELGSQINGIGRLDLPRLSTTGQDFAELIGIENLHFYGPVLAVKRRSLVIRRTRKEGSYTHKPMSVLSVYPNT